MFGMPCRWKVATAVLQEAMWLCNDSRHLWKITQHTSQHKSQSNYMYDAMYFWRKMSGLRWDLNPRYSAFYIGSYQELLRQSHFQTLMYACLRACELGGWAWDCSTADWVQSSNCVHTPPSDHTIITDVRELIVCSVDANDVTIRRCSTSFTTSSAG